MPVTSSVAQYTPTVEKIGQPGRQAHRHRRLYAHCHEQHSTGELSLTAPTTDQVYGLCLYPRENHQWYLSALQESEMQVEVHPPAPTDALVEPEIGRTGLGTADAHQRG